MQKNPTDQIASALFNAFTMLKNRLGFKARLLHLPIAQIETLRMIDQKKEVLMKEVSDFLAITPPSATALINTMAKAGYVKRGSSKNDRRTIRIFLTKKGRLALEKSAQERCKDLKKLMGNLNHGEQLELVNILKKMTS